MIPIINKNIGNTKAFSLVEVLIGIALSALLVSLLTACLFQWGLGWKKGSDRIQVEQNGRMAFAFVVQELKHHAGEILEPHIGREADFIKFRDVGNFRTFRFYTKEKDGIPVVYRFVLSDINSVPGVNPLTDPSIVTVEKLRFRRLTQNTIEITLIIKSKDGQFEDSWQTLVLCENHI